VTENTRRLKSCVEAWPGCAEGEYDPRCCRFPKSCSCDIIHNQALLDDPKWCEENLEPLPSARVITEGSGLTWGPTQSSVSVTLADATREEIQNLRMHYIDVEQILALHTWQAINPGSDPHVALLAEWRMAGMEKWEREFPNLAALLWPNRASN